MALTQCPDCGGKLSTAAPSCPHCGECVNTDKQLPSLWTDPLLWALVVCLAIAMQFGNLGVAFGLLILLLVARGSKDRRKGRYARRAD